MTTLDVLAEPFIKPDLSKWAARDRSDEIKVSGSLTFRVKDEMYPWFLSVMGLHFPSLKMPVHDPPVAWRVDDHPKWGGFPVIVCPGVEVLRAGYLPAGVPVLDGEPGRR